MKVLKFGAVWCNGCLVMRPRWEKVQQQLPWLKSGYFEFDLDEDAVAKYQVEGGKLPCAIWLDKNQQEITRRAGEVSEAELINLCNKHRYE